MFEFAVVVLGVLVVAAFLCGKAGYHVGARRAISDMISNFTKTMKLSGDELNKMREPLKRRTFLADGSLHSIADRLSSAAFNNGQEFQRSLAEPKPDESVVTMKTAELETVAWLADMGLRTLIDPDDNPFRFGDRLAYEKAEELRTILDVFERRSVPNLLMEPEREKERRFNNHENRMLEVWRGYGKLNNGKSGEARNQEE